MRRIHVLSVIAALGVLACSGGGGGPTPPDDDDDDPGPGPQQTLGSITANVTALNLAAGATATISVTAYDVNDQIIESVASPTFSSANTSVAVVESDGRVIGLLAGSGQINVSLSHGGVTRTTQVPVTVTGSLPANEQVVASGTDYVFTPRVVAVQAGGSVTWQFGALEHTVTFSTAPGAPTSITSGGYSSSISRTFSAAGNFIYSCTLHPGMSGQVYVR
ncbi:MAG TPA: hypothetical protein VLE53_17160 [Gemmatimonadaceae bacterium]|nr:hypothetical protein [Gemmatimonadaceae bacterium]